MRKKLLALALALVMALTLLPALPAAQAADVPGPDDLSIIDADFGNVEKGVNPPGDLTESVLITNTSGRTIYIGNPKLVETSKNGTDRVFIYSSYLEVFGGYRTLDPGETSEIPFNLRAGEPDSYPYQVRKDYVFRASFFLDGQSFSIDNIYYTGKYVPEERSALFSFSALATLTKGDVTLTASPSFLDFGSVDDSRTTGEPYTLPAPQTVTITNTGSGVAELRTGSNSMRSSCTASDPEKLYKYYMVTAPENYKVKLLPGESAEFTVQPLEHLAAEDCSGTLFLETTDGVQVPISVHFTVNGVQLEQSYSFGEVVEGSIPANATITVPIKNETNKTISLQQPYFSNDLWQIIIGPLSQTTIGPGETATFDLTVRPTSKAGSYSGHITIKGADGEVFLSSGASVTVLAPGSTPTNPFIPSQPDQPAPPEAPAEQPSSWAQADVTAAVAANLVPAELQAKYTQAITRAEFCALADSLYTAVKGTAAPVDASVAFTDTTDPAILRMASAKVVNGVGGGKFNPEGQLTREQAAAMLSRLAEAVGKPLTGQTATFDDMSSVSAYAVEAVGQMQATGIMGGVGNNTFAPKNPYTREQSIVTILRLFNTVK